MVKVGDKVRIILGTCKGEEFTVDKVVDDIVNYATGYSDEGIYYNFPLYFGTDELPRLEVLEPEDE